MVSSGQRQQEFPTMQSDRVQLLLDIWNGGPADVLPTLISDDYRGHMLHLPSGERDAAQYGDRIRDYRASNPNARFERVEWFDAGDRVLTRLRATRHEVELGLQFANGINISRIDVDGRIAEEWAIWTGWMDDRATSGS